MFFGGQIGPDAHVQHHHIPLRVTERIRRTDIMTVTAVLGPELRPALSSSRACAGNDALGQDF